MGFKLLKNKSMAIVKDAITTSFGFGTKKERMDANLETYKKAEIDSFNYALANRKILISELEMQIANYEGILKPIDEYLRIYQEIEDLVEKEIIKPQSEVKLQLFTPDYKPFATGNYYVLNDLIRLKKYADYTVFLVTQLEEKKEECITLIIDSLIKYKGKIYINNHVIENSELHYLYLQLEQTLNVNNIRNGQGSILNFSLSDFTGAVSIKETLKKEKSYMGLILIKLRAQLDKLLSESRNDEHELKLIEQTKEVIRTSKEYVAARASHDYLAEIEKLKR